LTLGRRGVPTTTVNLRSAAEGAELLGPSGRLPVDGFLAHSVPNTEPILAVTPMQARGHRLVFPSNLLITRRSNS
jgi:hypothetical protein